VIIKEEVTVTKTETVIHDILCNKCGKSCRTPIGNYEGLIEVKVQGGYDSPVVGDMTTWTFSLCQYCIAEFGKSFKIPIEINDTYFG